MPRQKPMAGKRLEALNIGIILSLTTTFLFFRDINKERDSPHNRLRMSLVKMWKAISFLEIPEGPYFAKIVEKNEIGARVSVTETKPSEII